MAGLFQVLDLGQGDQCMTERDVLQKEVLI